MSLDRTWYLDVNQFARDTPALHGTLAAYALWGGLVALAALVLGTWWFLARRPRGESSPPASVALIGLGGAGAVVALGANQLIGHAVARVRPCLAMPHALTLLTCPHDASFPSDHAMVAGALVVALFLVDRRVGAAGLVLAVLLAFARVYAGIHYPGDVAAGLVIGAAIDAVVVLALRPIAVPLAERLAATPLRPLLTAAPPPGLTGRPAGTR